MLSLLLMLSAGIPNESLAVRLGPIRQSLADASALVQAGENDSAARVLNAVSAAWEEFRVEVDPDSLVRPYGWTADIARISGALTDISAALAEADATGLPARLARLQQLLTWLPRNKPEVMKFSGFKCASCIELEKVLEDVAEDYAGRVVFREVDANQEEELVREHRVTTLPTTIFLDRKRNERFRVVRELTEGELRAKLDALMR